MSLIMHPTPCIKCLLNVGAEKIAGNPNSTAIDDSGDVFLLAHLGPCVPILEVYMLIDSVKHKLLACV